MSTTLEINTHLSSIAKKLSEYRKIDKERSGKWWNEEIKAAIENGREEHMGDSHRTS